MNGATCTVSGTTVAAVGEYDRREPITACGKRQQANKRKESSKKQSQVEGCMDHKL